MARPKWCNTNGGLDTDENARLDAFNAKYEIDIYRKAEVDHDFNMRRHRLGNCKWWRKGVGQMVSAEDARKEWVESPAVVLSKHEERS